MEAAAKFFEQEDGILSQTKSDQNMYSYPLSNMFRKAEANGYKPYCELKLDSVVEFYTTPEQTTNNQECGTQSQFVFRPSLEYCMPEAPEAATTLCSLSEPVESSSALNNAEGHVSLKLQSGAVKEEGGERTLNNECESSPSPAQYHESSCKPQGDLHRSDAKPIVDNESDDSDSEMFRVKRPSSLKAERRSANDALSMKYSEQQGLKRMKKVVPDGRSGQAMDSMRSSESSQKYSHQPFHKVDGEISSRERFTGANNNIPISVRYKKFGNDVISRQRDHHRKDKVQQSIREPPSIEIGPKRLKVRGPSFLSVESRLN
ncbi:hypothetical protein PIB30_008348 [Stylosanthes scabra]|uniref:Uncharacterized protein n=1 Tax=Stylosanthes scabra TaxID=79078 RepID=A0ABU6T4R7_9FABA|nr:hypothetical protein [Stylosanthes scabra]